MTKPNDLPRLPDDRLENPQRKIDELKPGEQAVLSLITNLAVDEEGRLWVDMSTTLMPIPVVAGMSLRAERTEQGFIVWLDKEVKFRRRPLSDHRRYLPAVEFREAPEEN